MPITVLDPKPALVVIDLQNGLRAFPMAPYSVDDVIGRVAELAAAFREHKFPVVLVNAITHEAGRTDQGRRNRGEPAPDASDLVPELNVQDSDHRITKATWGAFSVPELDSLLKDLGVTQVVIAGVATSMGVESTARSAFEHGYNVVLATDGMTDPVEAVHLNSVERIFPRLAETAKVSEILALVNAAS